jgi:hypothetical protein
VPHLIACRIKRVANRVLSFQADVSRDPQADQAVAPRFHLEGDFLAVGELSFEAVLTLVE